MTIQESQRRTVALPSTTDSNPPTPACDPLLVEVYNGTSYQETEAIPSVCQNTDGFSYVNASEARNILDALMGPRVRPQFRSMEHYRFHIRGSDFTYEQLSCIEASRGTGPFGNEISCNASPDFARNLMNPSLAQRTHDLQRTVRDRAGDLIRNVSGFFRRLF